MVTENGKFPYMPPNTGKVEKPRPAPLGAGRGFTTFVGFP